LTGRPRIRAVVFDVGEVLIDETTEYGTWADWLGVPRHTFSINRRRLVHLARIHGSRDCPVNGVSGLTRRAAAWWERVADDRDTGGREPTITNAGTIAGAEATLG
jgi:hypothetical protein